MSVGKEKREGTQDLLPLFPETCITAKVKSNLQSVHEGVSENQDRKESKLPPVY